MYQNSQGIREPWIKWVSDVFSASGYDPVRRCQEVSGRLETYRRNKQLKYITVGRNLPGLLAGTAAVAAIVISDPAVAKMV